MEWIRAQGLERPVDLRFAFLSKEEAERQGGPEVAELWQRTAEQDQDLPVCWNIVARAKEKPRKVQRPAARRPSIAKWSGQQKGAVRRQLSDMQDAEDRKKAAAKVIQTAKSWGAHCKLMRTLIGRIRR